MTVEYELGLEDVVAFQLHHERHSRAGARCFRTAWRGSAIVWVGVSVLVWYCFVSNGYSPVDAARLALPLFILVVYCLWRYPRNYFARIQQIATEQYLEGNNRGLFCRHRLTISPEGVSDETEFGEGKSAWAAVEQVGANADYFFVYLSAASAFIVPRRAFVHDWNFDDFVATARRYHEQARGTMPADVANA